MLFLVLRPLECFSVILCSHPLGWGGMLIFFAQIAPCCVMGLSVFDVCPFVPRFKAKSSDGNQGYKVGEFSGVIHPLIEVQPGMNKNVVNGQSVEMMKVWGFLLR